MKRHFVAQTASSKYKIGIFSIEDVAALLNANKIQDDFVATECNLSGPSYAKIIQSGDAKWVTIAQLLEADYKDKPIITVALKDAENNEFLLSERYHSDAGPLLVAEGAMENYFDQHFKELAKVPPKEFLLYFKSDKCPPSVWTIKLKVGNHIVYRGVRGSKHDPAEEICHYTYDKSEPRNVSSPDEFPSVALELKPPKYDPTTTLPRGWD